MNQHRTSVRTSANGLLVGESPTMSDAHSTAPRIGAPVPSGAPLRSSTLAGRADRALRARARARRAEGPVDAGEERQGHLVGPLRDSGR